MKTVEQILSFKPTALDGRDFSRLSCFLTFEQSALLLARVGRLKDDAEEIARLKREWPAPEPLTEEAVLGRLRSDVAFGFEKALDRRGISASLMNDVVRMWLWVLDDPLADMEEYAQYGLPLLKAAAVKYGLPNPIGEDSGAEYRYSDRAGYEDQGETGTG